MHTDGSLSFGHSKFINLNQCGIFMSQIYFQWEKILNGINKRFII